MIHISQFDFEFIPSILPSHHLMLVFHGQGDSIKPFFYISEELGLKKMNYLLINAPRKYLSGYSWYPEPPLHQRGILRTRFLLFEMLRELQRQGWSCKNMFLFGYSQGAQVVYDLALHSGQTFGGVIGISGYFVFFPGWRSRIGKKTTQTPWIVTHGKYDRVLNLDRTLFGVRKLRSAGLLVSLKVLNKGHRMSEADLRFVRKWFR